MEPDEYERYTSERYEKLKQSTPEERLQAVIWFWEQAADDHSTFVAGLREGFALAQPDGWRYVAPAWLRESEKWDVVDVTNMSLKEFRRARAAQRKRMRGK